MVNISRNRPEKARFSKVLSPAPNLPVRCIPPKHTTSLLTLAKGLPSLVEASGHETMSGRAEPSQLSRQTDRLAVQSFHTGQIMLLDGLRPPHISDLYIFFVFVD